MVTLSRHPYFRHHGQNWWFIVAYSAKRLLALFALFCSMALLAAEERPWRSMVQESSAHSSSSRSHVTVSSDSSTDLSSRTSTYGPSSTDYSSSSSSTVTNYSATTGSSRPSTAPRSRSTTPQTLQFEYAAAVNMIVGGLVEYYGALSWIHWDSLLRVMDVTSESKEKLLPHLGIRHKPGDPYQDDEFSQTKLSLATLAYNHSYYRLYENLLALTARRADGLKPDAHPGHRFLVALVQAVLRERHPNIVRYLQQMRAQYRDHYAMEMFDNSRMEKLYSALNWSVEKEKTLKQAFYTAFDDQDLWSVDYSSRLTPHLTSLGLISMTMKQRIRSLPTARDKNQALFDWFDTLGAGGYLAFLQGIAKTQVLKSQAVSVIKSVEDREIAADLDGVMNGGRLFGEVRSEVGSESTVSTLYSQYSSLANFAERVRVYGWNTPSSTSSFSVATPTVSERQVGVHPSSRRQSHVTMAHQQLPQQQIRPQMLPTHAEPKPVQAWVQETAKASAQGFESTESHVEWDRASQFSSVSQGYGQGAAATRMPTYSNDAGASSVVESDYSVQAVGQSVYQSQIEELTKQLAEQRLQLEQQSDVLRCGICFDLRERWMVGPCGHEYCESCTKSIRQDRNGRIRCPSCSRVQSVSDYITRYQSLPQGLLSDSAAATK